MITLLFRFACYFFYFASEVDPNWERNVFDLATDVSSSRLLFHLITFLFYAISIINNAGSYYLACFFSFVVYSLICTEVECRAVDFLKI